MKLRAVAAYHLAGRMMKSRRCERKRGTAGEGRVGGAAELRREKTAKCIVVVLCEVWSWFLPSSTLTSPALSPVAKLWLQCQREGDPLGGDSRRRRRFDKQAVAEGR